jgi:hypothetical protein
MYLRTVVFDGTATHTSTATSEILSVDQLMGTSSGRAIASVQNILDLPATNLPVSTAQVRVEAYAVLESTTTALPVAPLVISAWRTSP